jgi:hypothetical protein
MFVRWKHRRLRQRQETAHYAVLVRSVWRRGTPRQQVVCYLGAIRAPERGVPAACHAFWQQAMARLARLRLDPLARQTILARLAQVVPCPPGTVLEWTPEAWSLASLVPTEEPRGTAPVGTRRAPVPGRLPGGLHVRWKRRRLRRSGEMAWDAVLVHSVRIAGRPRQQLVGYLASIRAQYHTAPVHRAWFWTRAEAHLEALGLDAGTRQAVEAQLQQVIPRPTDAELQHLASQRAVFARAEALAAEDCCSAHDPDRWPDHGHYTVPETPSGEGGT